jgi:hypothetical protein
MAWAKLDDGYYDNPKMLAVGLVGTGLHARAITYTARHGTDGRIPEAWVRGQLSELSTAEGKRVLAALISNGALHQDDAGGYVVNDYLDYNPPAAEQLANRDDISAKRAAAGRKGAAARWQGHSKTNGKPDGNLPMAQPMAQPSTVDGPVPVPVPTNSSDAVRTTDNSATAATNEDHNADGPRPVGHAIHDLAQELRP